MYVHIYLMGVINGTKLFIVIVYSFILYLGPPLSQTLKLPFLVSLLLFSLDGVGPLLFSATTLYCYLFIIFFSSTLTSYCVEYMLINLLFHHLLLWEPHHHFSYQYMFESVAYLFLFSVPGPT